MHTKAYKYYSVALGVVALDQILKLWVHFNMKMGLWGQIKLLGNWFKLLYTLNPGMAFGIQFGFSYDKLVLTIIRIIATICIIHYIWKLSLSENVVSSLDFAPLEETKNTTALDLQSQALYNRVFIYGWALVLGGAAGNGIDSIFYGKLLNNAPVGAPTPWLSGQVIDMLYIDLWSGKLPHWVPFLGNNFVTCLPIFNLADVAILAGIGLVILTNRHHYAQKTDREVVDCSNHTMSEESI